MQANSLLEQLQNVHENGRIVILDPTGHSLEIDNIYISEETTTDPYDENESYFEAVITITTTPKEKDA